jgi:nucleotide-binding universal stress UspA family protein
MKTLPAILLPTDLSPDAEASYPFAARFARALDLPIRLLFVDAFGDVRRESATEGPTTRGRLAGVETLLSVNGVEVTTRVRSGFPAREIASESENDTTLIILGLRGSVGRAHPMLGSIAGKVLRTTLTDTLIVRNPMEDRPIRRILVPLDFSELATGAFDNILDVAKAFGASVELVHVVTTYMAAGVGPELEMISHLASTSEAELRNVAVREIARFVDHATDAGVGATARIMSHAEAPRGVVDTIAASDPDLVVMTGHGRHGFSRLLLGSVSEDVVRASPRPVLVLKAHIPFHDVLSRAH